MYLHVFCEGIVKEFYFPDVLDGRFMADLYSHETGLKANIQFSVYVSNGLWKLISKNRFEIAGARRIQECPLMPNQPVSVRIYETNTTALIMPTVMDAGSVNFKKYYAQGMHRINIGKREDNEIQFDSPLVTGHHALISFKDKAAFIEDLGSKNGVYINGRRISEPTRLNFGDVIYICGLKIIHMDNLIALNEPGNKVKAKLYEFIPAAARAESAQDEPQQDEDQYFTRSPRIVKRFETDPQDIDPPTPRKDQKQPPVILAIGPSMTMGLGMIIGIMITMLNNGNLVAQIAGIVMAVTMLSGAVLWPILLRRYNDKATATEENQRKNRYMSYITNLDMSIGKKSEYNREVLEETFLNINQCVLHVQQIERRLWERNPQNADFLDIRIGRGSRDQMFEINIPKERFTMDDDPLRMECVRIQKKYQFMNDTPITLNMRQDRMVGLIGDKRRLYDLARCFVIQLAALHCYDELKMCFIYTEENAPEWDFTRWLPHTYTKNREMRLISSREDQLRAVLYFLETEFEERKRQMKEYSSQAIALPHYVIFVANNKAVEKERFFTHMAEEGDKLGISFVFISERIDMLPSGCNLLIQYSAEESYVYNKNDKRGLMQNFTPDTSEGVNLTDFSKRLLNIHVREQSESAAVPDSLTFFELYNADVIEDLIIAQRWEQSLSYKTLDAPIGIASGDEVFSLNIHEKYDGPHGLIAGTTGSGKSEFIQSYILSMAVNYHPHDVAFILIDFKGGGMANLFENLPHVAGTITNLDGNQVRRSLMSIKAELERRQAMFKQAGVNNIDDYQKLRKDGDKKAQTPLPHLVLIADEFAELKAKEPDFMQELVSTARIGRSLGVHLILATQKPSGVVDDQIWSNTRFRICLKVASKMDSTEMLKRPDAAAITQKGRAYIQVGNDEIFRLIQGGWSGAPYFKDNNTRADKLNETVDLIDLCGRIEHIAELPGMAMKTKDTQLTAIVNNIAEYAKLHNTYSPNLIMAPLENIISWESIEKRGGGFNGEIWQDVSHWLEVSIGQYDDPSKQVQDTLTVNFGLNGGAILYGTPGTGKTTFIQTLIYALAMTYSPELVNMYVLDFGGRSSLYLKEAPHVGDVIFSDDVEKLERFFPMIDREKKRREDLFAKHHVGTIQAYRETDGEKLPAIIILLDNYAAFAERFSDYENNIITRSRDGANYGIYFVITASGLSAVKSRITDNFKVNYSLQLNDKFDYISIVGQTEGLTPERVKGRGMARLDRAVEFQTALPQGIVNESARSAKLKEIFEAMAKKWHGARTKHVPMIPEDVSLKELKGTAEYLDAFDKKLLPVGYEMAEAELIALDISDYFIFNVVGDTGKGKTQFLASIISIAREQYNWEVHAAGARLAGICSQTKADYVDTDATIHKMIIEMDAVLTGRKQEYEKRAAEQGNAFDSKACIRNWKPILLVIDDFERFHEILSDDTETVIENMLAHFAETGALFIASSRGTEQRVVATQSGRKFFNGANGLLLGGGMNNQNVFNVNLPYPLSAAVFPAGEGFLINKGNCMKVRTQRL